MASRKRSKIRTLNDINSAVSSSNNKHYKSHNNTVRIAHIPNLHNAAHAKSLLDRISKEFVPLLQKRGYPVKSVSEMCCCGDGLDHAQSGRKRRIMGKNVLGYNQTVFYRGKTNTIHLRLRQPTQHNVFYDYESIAGTMSHELAHCEIGPHNAQFYRLMDEIQEQHAVYLTKGIVADAGGFPMNSTQAHVLGGRRSHDAAQAAQRRQQRQRLMPQGPQRLGGTTGEFTQWLRPGEAAGMAAEARRLEDEVWCQPCEPQEIELSDDDDDDELVARENDDTGDQKIPAVSLGQNSASSNNVDPVEDRKPSAEAIRNTSPASIVDLTVDDKVDESPGVKRASADAWPCTKCTFRNTALALVCAVCGSERRDDGISLQMAQELQARERIQAQEESERLARRMHRDETVEHVKEQEVAQSMRDFGFNVYGNDKQGSSTMKHLT